MSAGRECGILASVRVGSVMSSPPIAVGVESSIMDAARAMYEGNVGSVVVVDSRGRLAGILTRRDLIYLVASGEIARNPPVRIYMSESVITCRPDEPLLAVAERMRSAGVRHVVVVDPSSPVRPVGVVSLWDILRVLAGRCVDLLGFG